MASIQPPKSPTLVPPRKNVELEDPGAHDLDSSNDEGDVFSDAHDGRVSPYSSTKLDAATDNLAVIAQGSQNEIATRIKGQDLESNNHRTSIPMTVVEKIDPAEPSHGDVPGTAAHEKRKADAVPDAILRAPSPGEPPTTGLPASKSLSQVPIPRTVVTKVDSEPRHGEVPGTMAYSIRTEDATPDVVEEKGDIPGWPTFSTRSHNTSNIRMQNIPKGASPIAEDGGFGPMLYDEDDYDGEDHDLEYRNERAMPEPAEPVDEDNFGSDFDDFEEGPATDELNDFDGESSHIPSQAIPVFTKQKIHTAPCPFPVLDFSTLESLDDIILATSPHLSALFPLASILNPSPGATAPEPTSVFLTDRSLSLWSQLVAPPPLQPPNWTRSRIRRLFLVSLGVPVDLDEILPASKQKKLILPYTPSEPTTSKEPRKGSVARLRDLDANTSNASLVSSPGAPTSSIGSTSKNRKRKGPPPPPEYDAVAVRQLCETTDAALEIMNDVELKAHVALLEELTQTGRQVLQYWLRRKEAAVGDKEAFEGVIENLVRHARRVRK